MVELIDAKRKGKKLPQRKIEKPKENVVKLAEVLRKSLAEEDINTPAKSTRKGEAA